MDLLGPRELVREWVQVRFYRRVIDPGLPGIAGTFDTFGGTAATSTIRAQLKNRRVGFL